MGSSHNSCKLYLSDHAWRVMRKDNCDALPLSHIWWRVSEWRLIEGWIALSTQPSSIIIIMSTQTQTVNHHTVSFTHLYKCHPFVISFQYMETIITQEVYPHFKHVCVTNKKVPTTISYWQNIAFKTNLLWISSSWAILVSLVQRIVASPLAYWYDKQRRQYTTTHQNVSKLFSIFNKIFYLGWKLTFEHIAWYLNI